MMPNLGQGGCQAIEDGFVLTDLLCSIDNKSQLKGVLNDVMMMSLESLDIPCMIALLTILFL